MYLAHWSLSSGWVAGALSVGHPCMRFVGEVVVAVVVVAGMGVAVASGWGFCL